MCFLPFHGFPVYAVQGIELPTHNGKAGEHLAGDDDSLYPHLDIMGHFVTEIKSDSLDKVFHIYNPFFLLYLLFLLFGFHHAHSARRIAEIRILFPTSLSRVADLRRSSQRLVRLLSLSRENGSF